MGLLIGTGGSKYQACLQHDGFRFEANGDAYRCTYLGVSDPGPRYFTATIMMKAAARFERILDPNDNWLVWDISAKELSALAGDALIGLTEAEAKAALTVLALLVDPASSSDDRSHRHHN